MASTLFFATQLEPAMTDQHHLTSGKGQEPKIIYCQSATQLSCRLRTDDHACPAQVLMRANQFINLQWPCDQTKTKSGFSQQTSYHKNVIASLKVNIHI